MRRKPVLSMLVAVGLSVALLTPEAAVAAPKPLVVGTDPVGDWNEGTGAPVGDELGQDLVKASIGMADKTTVNFIIQVSGLPSPGGVPEFTRYVWSLSINGKHAELDGKFTNYSRGVCDPTSGCPGTTPPRDPGMGPFFIRANCVVVQAVNTCQEVGIVSATFDAAAATITIPVPLSLLGAKPGSKIAPDVHGSFDGSIWATPSAFLSQATMPHDTMLITKVFVVPGGKKKKK